MIFAIATIALALLAAVPAATRADRALTYDRQRRRALRSCAAAPRLSIRCPAEHDGWLLVNRDDADDVVGVQLLAASEMPRGFWAVHPDREEIPADILAALDRWIGAAHLRPPAREASA
jgi:hypothetical protein